MTSLRLVFVGVFEASFDRIYCGNVLDSGGVFLLFLGLRLSELGVQGLVSHLCFAWNVAVFLLDFSEVISRVRISVFWD